MPEENTTTADSAGDVAEQSVTVQVTNPDPDPRKRTPKTDDPEPGAGDDAAQAAADGDDATRGPAQRTANHVRSLDDLLSDMDDDSRRVVQGAVSKARKEAQSLRDRLRTAEPKAAEFDKVLEAQKTAERRLQEDAAAAKEQSAALMQRLVRERLRSVAATKDFANADDAPAFLGNLAEFIGDDGEPDTTRISTAIDDLLVERPYLRRPDPKPRPPVPNRAQGSSGNGAPGIDQQIAEAQSRGDFRAVIALENSKFQQLGKS